MGPPHDERRLPPEHASRVGDGLAHADLRERAVDDHREATELGDAGCEGRLRAQGRLVEEHGHREGAEQRLLVVRRGLVVRREVEHPGLLLGGEVVVAQEVARSRSCRPAVRRVEDAPARPRGTSRPAASVSTSGGASRTRSGVGLLMMKPASSAAAVTSAESGSVRSRPISSPAPRTSVTRSSAAEAVAQVVAEVGDVLEQAVLLDRVHHRERCRGGDRVAAEGGAVVAGLEQVGRLAGGDAGTDREAARQALGDGDDVGHAVHRGCNGGALVGVPGAGAADAGLDLVEPQQRAVLGGDLPGVGEVVAAVARPRRPRPAAARGSRRRSGR